MAWTGFGGSWSGGVHSGGDSSGSIGGSSRGMRAPSPADIASQFNSYGGTQITASQVSNIKSDGSGGYKRISRGKITLYLLKLAVELQTPWAGFQVY